MPKINKLAVLTFIEILFLIFLNPINSTYSQITVTAFGLSFIFFLVSLVSLIYCLITNKKINAASIFFALSLVFSIATYLIESSIFDKADLNKPITYIEYMSLTFFLFQTVICLIFGFIYNFKKQKS